MAALRARRESPSGVREEDSGKVMIVITSITLRKKASRTSIFFFSCCFGNKELQRVSLV